MSTNQQNYNLGKIKSAELRSVWKDEARDFTPWLAKDENLALLSEALQLDNLIVVERESDVGNFSLDILAKKKARNVSSSSRTSWRTPITTIWAN